MRVLRLLFVLLILFAPRAGLACSEYPQPELPVYPLRIETAGGPLVLMAELAQSVEERACGLMGRPRLADGTGMLFDMRPAGPAYFWMRNTPEPLDMLFFDAEGRLVYIVPNAEPYSWEATGTKQPIAAVLELAAGEAARLGIGLGAEARLPWRGS